MPATLTTAGRPASAVPLSLFFRLFESIDVEMALLDPTGEILFVNRAWQRFGDENGLAGENYPPRWNYLQICRKAAAAGDDNARQVLEGLGQLIAGSVSRTSHEYPCHSPTQKRWFLLNAFSCLWRDTTYILVSHEQITQRKEAELALSRSAAVLKLLNAKLHDANRRLKWQASMDALTGLANRATLDIIAAAEWRRCRDDGQPLSLMMIDIDFFKTFNDQLGHPQGDECLREIASAINEAVAAAGGIAARYGGEEFTVVLPEGDAAAAVRLARRIQANVLLRRIPHPQSDVSPFVTLSIGFATTIPGEDQQLDGLIHQADCALYQAKNRGRNRVQVASCQPSQVAMSDGESNPAPCRPQPAA